MATASEELLGVDFPRTQEGRRSTTALGRQVTADALREVDATGAHHAEQETNWRTGYLLHFRRLVEAGIGAEAPSSRSPTRGCAR